MGKALAGGYRNKVFLMTKIDGRTKAAAAQQIDESLQRLQTDHVDLMQFHEVIRLEDPDRIFAKAVPWRRCSKREGWQSSLHRLHRAQGPAGPPAHAGHRTPAQLPLRHGADAAERDGRALPQLHQRGAAVLTREGIAPLGMKCFGDHTVLDYILANNTMKPIEALHYCLNLPIAVQITGIDSRRFWTRRWRRRAPSSRSRRPKWQIFWSAFDRPPSKASTNSTKPPHATTARRASRRCWADRLGEWFASLPEWRRSYGVVILSAANGVPASLLAGAGRIPVFCPGAPLHSKRVRPGILLRTFQESCGFGFRARGTIEQPSEPEFRARELRLIAANLRTLRALKTPAKIQKFIDALEYQYADTAGSPRRVLRERKGHCWRERCWRPPPCASMAIRRC